MGKPELILVVDDTPANLAVISEALTDADFEVATATDGERALKQIQYELPDLILLDVMMPGIDGFQTCQQLKKNPASQDIPVIFMTAVSDIASKAKAFELGAVDYITKPFQEEEILARIRTHLQLRNLTKNLEQQVAHRTVELSQALQELKASQIRLVQQEKLSTLGQLITGIAHEINNPLGFISSNLDCLKDYTQDLLDHLQLYQQKYSDVDIEAHAAKIDLEFLTEDLPKIAISMKSGADRIRNISTSLRTFSRSDTANKVIFNVHDGIDSTLLLLKHRLKANERRSRIVLTKHYGHLPDVSCYPGQLNQVFMNIFANAIDALDEADQQRTSVEIKANPHQITITTDVSTDGTRVVICIQDNGIGMKDEVRAQVFDHLFTTKAVGQGTGLGLAIAHQIIVEKHGGTIACASEPGKGTEFLMQLPIN
ncbi:MAG: response regulator [Cyanothece sp. SIO1E1]|nr:response regulator [Cyanothece sp. SIO1E1]